MVFFVFLLFLFSVPVQAQEQVGEKGILKKELERELLSFKEYLTLLKESGFENSVLFYLPSSLGGKKEKKKINPYLLFKERKELLWKLERRK